MSLNLPQLEMCPWATWKLKDKTVLLQMVSIPQSVTLEACNPVNFTIFDPEDPKWENDWQIARYIYSWGKDPGTILYFKRMTVSHKAFSHQVFHSFYEEMERPVSPISTTTRNLFLELVETIAQSLKNHFLLIPKRL
jgi:hypothetical protein